VTGIITGYALLDAVAEDRRVDRAKLASMLLLGHTITLSGTLLKTSVLFGMNPTAINWAQLLVMAPVSLAWIRECLARDERIDRGLAEEWQRLLVETADLAPRTGNDG